MTPQETAVPIFKKLFMIRVPVTATRSEQDIKLFGTVFTGNDDIDRGHLNEWVTVMWTINRMVESYKKGIPIKVINHDDTKVIYNHIQDHLSAWKVYKDNGINLAKVPYDDLVDLDAFANQIYDVVKYSITKEYQPKSTLNDYFRQLNFLAKQHIDDIIETPIQNVQRSRTWREDFGKDLPKRESYADYYKKGDA